MRFEIVREVFLKELRETLRDRRTLAVMFGIPVLLYPLLTLSTASVGASTVRKMRDKPARVAVLNGEDAPHLLEEMRKPESGVILEAPPDPEAAMQDNRLDAIVELSEDLERKALASEAVKVELRLDRSRNSAAFTQRKVEEVLDRFERWVIAQRLKARSVPESVLRPIESVTQDLASADRRLGNLLGMLLPTMLLITGMFGAFFPAINATTSERELGTLEALLVTPASKMELLIGKAALVLLCGLLTAAINLISMALVLWRVFLMSPRGGEGLGSLQLNVGALALTYVAALPTLIFFAAAVMVVGLFARNYREANSYATPVMLLSLVPTYVSLAEPKPTPGLLVMPLINTCLIMREVLAGHASPGGFVMAFASSALYAGLMLCFAARLFSTEQLVNPAWEPLSLKGFRRNSRPSRRRLPATDEALVIFAVSLLLTFYVSPAFAGYGFFVLLFVTQGLLVAGPALLFAWLGRYDWRATFAWRSPAPLVLIGAILLGLGLVPWIQAYSGLQNLFWPRDPETAKAIEALFRPHLERNPLATVLLVGLLAGLSEELLYRGPIQAALARKLPAWAAIGAGAFLFAIAHLDAHGIPARVAIGILLGWIVLRGGSLFPAIALHAVYDCTLLAFMAWGPSNTLFDLEAVSRIGQASPALWVPQLVVGTVLLAAGWAMCRKGMRKVPAGK